MATSTGAAQSGSTLSGELLAELLPMVAEINSVLDRDALLATIARNVRRILDYRILDLFLPGPDGRLRPELVEGYPAAAASRFSLQLGQGIVGTAAQSREPIFVPDVALDARYVSFFPDVKAELAIPLVHGDRLIGVLNIEGPDAEAFSPASRAALQVLAGHLASAIQNATLYRETRWYAELLATLYEIGKETASILELDELLHRVAEIVKRVIDYEMFGILLLDRKSDELVLRKAVSYGTLREKTRIKLGQGLCGSAALGKRAILVGDVREDPRYLNLIPETRSELVVPLMHQDRVVGVFDLESTQLDSFNEEHLQVLTPLASQVAVAIENARLLDELFRRDERLHRELSIARDVQHGLFPEEAPSGERWEASAHFLPARELGGDLYDFYHLEGDALGVAVGDVAGKGVAAALYGAFASGTVRARAARYPPAELLARVNRTLRRRHVEGLFCTLAIARFDFEAGRAVFANSGLPYPWHYRAASGRAEPIVQPGLPLGALDEATYEEKTMDLSPGDVFVFHTDGLTEASCGQEDYGGARLQRQIEQHARLSAHELGERILEDVHRLTCGRPVEDDLTLVVVKVR